MERDGKGIDGVVNKSDWRGYYRKKLFVDMLALQSRRVLFGHSSIDPSVKELIDMVRSGKDQIALKTLYSLTLDIDKSTSPDEVIFIAGLVYENLGLYPEADASYLRIASYYPSSSFLRKTELRRAFMKVVDGIKKSSNLSLKEAGSEFYRIYRESNDPLEWQDALAGYAIVLYLLGSYTNAEDVFYKIKGYIQDNPSYTFFQAESYIKDGKFQRAKEALQKLLKEYFGPFFLSYVLLRLGDIALMEGNNEEAETYYRRLIVEEGEKETGRDKALRPVQDYKFVMGTIALAELYMKQGNAREATHLLNDLLNRLEMEGGSNGFTETILYYLAHLSKLQDLNAEALSYSKQFLSLHPSSPLIEDVRLILNDSLYALIAGAYEKRDYPEVITIYQRNKGIINNPRVFAMVGESLLNMGLPNEAITVYKAIKGKKDTKALIGLAKGYILTGKSKEAIGILKDIKPLKDEEEREMAKAFSLLGDLHLRMGEHLESLRNYSYALRWLEEPQVYLKQARVLRMMGKDDDALYIYQDLLNRFLNNPKKEGWGRDIEAIVYVDMGDIYYSRKMWGDALDAYRKGVDGVDDQEERLRVTYRIGELSLRMGDKDSALRTWEKVFKDDRGLFGRLAGERLKEVGLWEEFTM